MTNFLYKIQGAGGVNYHNLKTTCILKKHQVTVSIQAVWYWAMCINRNNRHNDLFTDNFIIVKKNTKCKQMFAAYHIFNMFPNTHMSDCTQTEKTGSD